MNHNIQVLRAVAALSVLLFHAAPFYAQVGGDAGPAARLFGIGYLGVDLFFVISGFIIARGFGDGRASPGQAGRFLEKRAYRIFLGYWPVLALAVLYYRWAMPERLAQADPMAALFLLSHRIPELVIGQAWSLSFELFFYLLFGLLALAGRAAGRTVLAAYGAGIVLLNLQDPATAKGFFANPHLLELFAGMALGQTRPGPAWRRRIPLLGAAAAILFGSWLLLATPGRLATVSLVGGSALLLVLIADLRFAEGRNPPSLLSALGDSSYALYLLHYLLLEAFVRHGGAVDWLRPFLPALFPLWLVTIVALAHWHYVRVERPLYRWACTMRGLGQPRVAEECR